MPADGPLLLAVLSYNLHRVVAGPLTGRLSVHTHDTFSAAPDVGRTALSEAAHQHHHLGVVDAVDVTTRRYPPLRRYEECAVAHRGQVR